MKATGKFLSLSKAAASEAISILTLVGCDDDVQAPGMADNGNGSIFDCPSPADL